MHGLLAINPRKLDSARMRAIFGTYLTSFTDFKFSYSYRIRQFHYLVVSLLRIQNVHHRTFKTQSSNKKSFGTSKTSLSVYREAFDKQLFWFSEQV